ncbi:MAG: hypothetical protein WCW31_01040 [Patescibacteria group bacterium]
MTTKHAVLFAMLVAMLTFACQERVPIGEGEQLPAEQDATTPMVCDPGRQVECACLGGDKGVQVCADDGSRFEPCQCPMTPPDGGSDACIPTLAVTEKNAWNQPGPEAYYPAGSTDAVFLGLDFCANACGDFVVANTSIRLENMQPDHPLHIEDLWNFTNARLRGKYWADTISGPVNLVSDVESLGSLAHADFNNPFTIKASECVYLRFTIDIALTEAYPGTLYNNTFKASVLRVEAFGANNFVAIVHQDVIKTVTSPEVQDAGTDAPSNSAAYCDPLDWDPQKAYMGCCGTFTKVNPSDLKAGNLIKASGVHSVYYFGSDGKRYLFPTTIELDSWYAPIDYTYLPAHDYNQICLSVLEITEQQLANIPIGAQQVTRRPGAHVIGITTDPKRYVVDTHRVLRWASPQILEQIYGGPVDARTFLTPDAFFVNYLMGASISSASEYPFVTRYTEADIEVELGIKP